MALEFMECTSCAAKPGAPTLCVACVHNRSVIDELIRDHDQAASERDEVIDAVIGAPQNTAVEACVSEAIAQFADATGSLELAVFAAAIRAGAWRKHLADRLARTGAARKRGY